VLYLFYAVLAVLLAAGALLVVAIARGEEIDELLAELERRDREAAAFMASQINPATTTAHPLGDTPPPGLSDRMVDAARDRARLRIVDATSIQPVRVSIPKPRGGEHDDLPVADGHFPVHTDLDDDDLTALMRATEE
jgi:hypothetical protein